MADLGKAYVQIMPSAKGISGSISKAIKPEATKAGNVAGDSIMGGIMKIAGGIGITKALSWATSQLANNLQGAVSRYDAIENSKNVFKAMKFSTEEADQVTQYFQKTLDGLPTGFDEAIKGTQSFAGATKDLEWSGETWNALNNAVLAFGGTSEQTTRVTDTLTKSFSSGKIDGEAFRSMLANGLGPALQEMATRAGYNNLDELQDAFKNGELSAEDFGVMLQDVSENGSESLDSLEEVARANVMGIGTAFGLIKSRIVQGLEGVLRSVEDTLEKIGLPSIAEMIDAFSKNIRESIKKIGTGIEVLGDFVIEHKELFIGAWELMAGVVNMFKDLFTGNLTDVEGSFKETFDNIFLKINEVLPKFIETGFDMISNLITGITEKVPEFLEKGTELLANLARGFRDRFPDIVSAVFNMIATMLAEVARNFPQLLGAGVELILKLVAGIIKSIPNVVRAMVDVGKGVTNSVKNISLFNAGKAIINGFIDGLKSTWEAGKKFISGIGGWIKDNKGPISYDKKLLVGAGKAIMGGLDKGLQDTFPSVQKTIRGITGDLVSMSGDISYGALGGLEMQGSYTRGNKYVKPSEKNSNKNTEINVTNHNHSPKALTPREIAKQQEYSLRRLAWQL